MRHKLRLKSRKLKARSLEMMLLLSCTFIFSTVTAQESINGTGGSASGSGGSATYSVGQLVYQTYTGTGGSVAEGIQQPYEISVITAIEEAKGISLSVRAYPNPATDYLTLSIGEFDTSDLWYHLYDMRGKRLQKEKITGNQTIITMSNLVPATYFVIVIQGNREVKTLKIIKN